MIHFSLKLKQCAIQTGKFLIYYLLSQLTQWVDFTNVLHEAFMRTQIQKSAKRQSSNKCLFAF